MFKIVRYPLQGLHDALLMRIGIEAFRLQAFLVALKKRHEKYE
jgi:hypothetical protein